MTTESQPVSYSIEIPGLGYYYSKTITANNEDIVNLPSSVEVSSPDDQDKGIYLQTSSERVTVIGQNVAAMRATVDTFLALPIQYNCAPEYIYYGITVQERRDNFNYSILIVGTENKTIMNLTVTQPVTIKVDDTDNDLTPDSQYSFVINRLQTVYVGSVEDLTGTKIVTSKPVSVFNGHQYDGDNEYHIEQVPPTISWGRVHYTAPLATRRSYGIKVLAVYNSTNFDVYCIDTKRSYTINKGKFINMKFTHQDYCAMYSSKDVSIVQLALDSSDDKLAYNSSIEFGDLADSMMSLVPATHCYTNKLVFSTVHNNKQKNYDHFVNIIVLAQYYQPDMIYLISGGVNKSLDTQEWVPVKVNNVTEAYAVTVSIPEGVAEIIHANISALMIAIVYGFGRLEGYGHPGGFAHHKG